VFGRYDDAALSLSRRDPDTRLKVEAFELCHSAVLRRIESPLAQWNPANIDPIG